MRVTTHAASGVTRSRLDSQEQHFQGEVSTQVAWWTCIMMPPTRGRSSPTSEFACCFLAALALLLPREVVAAAPAYCQTSTIAGSPTRVSGATDGVGTVASFKGPSMGVFSGDGSVLYLADTGNHLVRSIVVATVTVSTLAGLAPTGAFADGVGSNARFNSPAALAVNATTLLVADRSNYAVRRITAAGVVTTWVGRPPLQGFNDGVGTSASFGGPQGLTVDPTTGNVFVMDGNPTGGTKSATMRLVTPAGVVTTVLAVNTATAGALDGIGTSVTFSATAKALVLVNSTTLAIADSGSKKIRFVNIPTFRVSTFAGSGGAADVSGVGTNAGFNGADGMCIDATGTLFVAELNGGTLRAVTTPGANVSTLAFTGAVGFADGACLTATANSPTGVAVDAAGNLYVFDNAYNNVRFINRVATPSAAPSLLPSAKAVATSSPSATVTLPTALRSATPSVTLPTVRVSPSGSATLLASASSLLSIAGTQRASASRGMSVSAPASFAASATVPPTAPTRIASRSPSVSVSLSGTLSGSRTGVSTPICVAPPGYACTVPGGNSSTATQCAAGSWSAGGSQASCAPCAAGVYGSTGGLTTAACTGLCDAGRYGTPGQTLSTCTGACSPGFSCIAGSTSANASVCPLGAYCPGGTAAVLCPLGSYGATQGLTNASCSGLCNAGFFGGTAGQMTSACSGPCWAGHYCPAGSTSWRTNNCGVGHYCPEGSSAPTACPAQGLVDPVRGPSNGPAFLVDTAVCLAHCYNGAPGQLSAC